MSWLSEIIVTKQHAKAYLLLRADMCEERDPEAARVMRERAEVLGREIEALELEDA